MDDFGFVEIEYESYESYLQYWEDVYPYKPEKVKSIMKNIPKGGKLNIDIYRSTSYEANNKWFLVKIYLNGKEIFNEKGLDNPGAKGSVKKGYYMAHFYIEFDEKPSGILNGSVIDLLHSTAYTFSINP